MATRATPVFESGWLTHQSRPRLACIATLALCLLLERSANAQTPAANGPSTDARAVELFHEGRALLVSEKYAEACAKFRQSSELQRSPGILLNVGDCFAREGAPLRALETYEEALAVAERMPDSPSRTAKLLDARREIDALSRQFADVRLSVTATPGQRLLLDGKPLEPPAQRLLLAPGPHVIEASAAGHAPERREFNAAAGAKLDLTLPPLRALPSSQPLPVAQPPYEASEPPPALSMGLPSANTADTTDTPVLPWVLIGTGSAVVGAGIVTGLITLSRESELAEGCGGDKLCPTPDEDLGWQDKIDSANDLALVTNVLWIAGLTTAGIGITLLAISPDEPSAPQTSRVEGGCFQGSCGLRVQGRF